MSKKKLLTNEDFASLATKENLLTKLKANNSDVGRILFNVDYEKQLKYLQTELIKLQNWVVKKKLRIAILFEGRDAAGKGGAIKRFVEHLNPRAMRIVALAKPTEIERHQWYFRRYVSQLPNAGEIVFFDRSWYNRAVVEPVMDFCTHTQYEQFMRQVPEFEHMLFEDDIRLIKFWFSISKEEQEKRFEARRLNPLKHWKLSAIDEKGQELWDRFTYYKELMFSRTHTSFSSWVIVRTNKKKIARLESIRYVLSRFEYEGKATKGIFPHSKVITRFYHSNYSID